ncbi:hypothetical protein ASPCADRAFT_204994, partial [Aspergillus carbonarius ITEM 5010]
MAFSLYEPRPSQDRRRLGIPGVRAAGSPVQLRPVSGVAATLRALKSIDPSLSLLWRIGFGERYADLVPLHTLAGASKQHPPSLRRCTGREVELAVRSAKERY